MTGAEIVASYEKFRQEMRRLIPGISDAELHSTMLDAVKNPSFKVAVPGLLFEELCVPYCGPANAVSQWFGVQLVGDTFKITPI